MAVVAFDLDGTLEDSRDDMVAAVNRVRSILGLAEREPQAIRPHVNRGMDHLYRTCFDEKLDPRLYRKEDGYLEASAVYDEVRRLYEHHYGEHIADQTRLYDGIRAALEAVSAAGHTLALVTNKPETLSRQLLDALGIGHLFSAVIGGDTCKQSKPHAEPLQEAIRQCGGGPAVMVGDSQGDIRCGQAAGVPVIWCAWGYAQDTGELVPDAQAMTPDKVLGTVRDLLG